MEKFFFWIKNNLRIVIDTSAALFSVVMGCYWVYETVVIDEYKLMGGYTYDTYYQINVKDALNPLVLSTIYNRYPIDTICFVQMNKYLKDTIPSKFNPFSNPAAWSKSEEEIAYHNKICSDLRNLYNLMFPGLLDYRLRTKYDYKYMTLESLPKQMMKIYIKNVGKRSLENVKIDLANFKEHPFYNEPIMSGFYQIYRNSFTMKDTLTPFGKYYNNDIRNIKISKIEPNEEIWAVIWANNILETNSLTIFYEGGSDIIFKQYRANPMNGFANSFLVLSKKSIFFQIIGIFFILIGFIYFIIYLIPAFIKLVRFLWKIKPLSSRNRVENIDDNQKSIDE